MAAIGFEKFRLPSMAVVSAQCSVNEGISRHLSKSKCNNFAVLLAGAERDCTFPFSAATSAR